MPWDILKDFEPVSLVATVEWGLVVNTDAPDQERRRPDRRARKAPGKINYGSGGNGSPQHIAMALFASQAGVQMTHVPYKGATQAAMGVAGKEVDAAFQGIATVNSLIKAGKLRLIGVTTPRRMPQFPDVPTVSESGLPGFEFNSWFARDGAGRHAEGHREPLADRSEEGAGRPGGAREAECAGPDAEGDDAGGVGDGDEGAVGEVWGVDSQEWDHGRVSMQWW